jgi:hypothetical protein
MGKSAKDENKEAVTTKKVGRYVQLYLSEETGFCVVLGRGNMILPVNSLYSTQPTLHMSIGKSADVDKVTVSEKGRQSGGFSCAVAEGTGCAGEHHMQYTTDTPHVHANDCTKREPGQREGVLPVQS